MTQPEMRGKVCVVTGASSGLGRATASGLAKLGATVILACRDQQRGKAALEEIQATSGSKTVELMLVDLSAQQAIRSIAAEFEQRHDKLDVLINNAAIFKNKRVVTADGLETMFATNHLGPFLLTNLLLERLKNAPSSRVLTITAPSTTPLHFDDLQGKQKFNAFEAFGASKMCNLLFTYELARRLSGTRVSANAIHPGLVRSNLMREAAAPVRWMTALISAPPERAARVPVYYASSPEVEGLTGKFCKDRRAIDSDAYSRNPEIQKRLWDVSLTLTGLQDLV